MNKLLRSLLLFGLLFANHLLTQAQTQEPLVTHIQQLQATVENRRAFLTDLRPDGNYMLPIGLLRSGEGNKPGVLIDEIALYKDYAELKAYVVLQIPGCDQPLYFATVQPVKIGYKGGILGAARMELVADKRIRVGGDDTYLNVKKGDGSGSSGTFIEFDCNGFSRASLDVEAQLSRKLVKENTDGSQNLSDAAADRIKARFRLEFADLNDIIASATIEPFQIRGVPRLTFEVQDAVFDLSDLSNAPAVQFPAGYLNDYYQGVSPNLWRGFYLKKVSVKLPGEIKDRTVNGRKEILVEDLLIDNHGVSGTAAALNLMRLENGDMSGWSYSIDRIAVTFKANQFVGGGLGGGLVLPIGKDDTSLQYDAFIDQGMNFGFTVKADETIQVPMFVANMQIYQGSTIDVTVVDRKFQAGANLSGVLSIGAKEDGDTDPSANNGLHIPDLAFNQLKISTTAPYVHSGTFSMSSVGFTYNGFKTGFRSIYMVRTPENVGLHFQFYVGMNNPEDGENGFAAEADLNLLGRVDIASNGRHRYVYSKMELERVHLNINQGSFSLIGELNVFRRDEVFGRGFKAQLQMKLPMKIAVGATAIFGNVDGFRYWYTDALAAFENGIKVTPPFQITGFAGGLYYRVKQKPAASVSAIAIVNSQTGLAYLPDATAGIGVRAGVMFSIIGSPKTFNGNVGLEISFNRGGGINRAMLRGYAAFMQDPETDILGSSQQSAYAQATTEPGTNSTAVFDAVNKSGALTSTTVIEYVETDPQLATPGFFQLTFSTRLNVAGGLLTGQFNGEAYFSSSTWHIFLGTPQNRNYIDIAGLAQANAYFMVGKNLPESGQIPDIVRQSIGYYKGLSSNTSSLGRGSGFAFGAGLSVNTGDLNFLIFYGNFQAGIGFDVALKNYGSSVSCAGRSGPIGINGWYASGSAYAYVSGAIGIRVKIFGRRRSFEILSIRAGALLQAKLPNPTWFNGAVGGSYRILGGLVRGSCRFQVTIGDQCQVIGTPEETEADIKIINEILPENGEQDVSPLTNPKVRFEIPLNGYLGGEMSYGGADDITGPVNFRPTLKNLTVTVNGQAISGTQQLNYPYKELVFIPDAILPGNATVVVTAEVKFQYQWGAYYQYYGQWTDYTVNGVPFVEKRVSTFKTAETPVKLSSETVKYTYPMQNQQNYYQEETHQGYIAMNSRQNYLFDPASGINPYAVLLNPDGTETPVTLNFNAGESKLNFTMPTLTNNVTYSLIIRPGSAASLPTTDPMDDEETVSLPEIYRLNFKTSKYSSLAAKLAAAQLSKTSDTSDQIELSLNSDEEFAHDELFKYYDNLIAIDADMSFLKEIPGEGNMYLNYPQIPDFNINEAVEDGLPVMYMIGVSGSGSNISLTYYGSNLRNHYNSQAYSYTSYFYQNTGQGYSSAANDLYGRLRPAKGMWATYTEFPSGNGFPYGYPYFGYYGHYGSNYFPAVLWNTYNNDPNYYEDITQYEEGPGWYTYRNYDKLYAMIDSYFIPTIEADAAMVAKLNKIVPFVGQSFEDSELNNAKPHRVKVKYVLPGTGIVTSTNYITIP